MTVREPDDSGGSARTQGFRRSARQLEALDLGLEARPEDRCVKRVFEAIAHERRVIIFDVHIEFADVRHEEVHDLAVVE